jgi:hypothetical protein
LRRFRHKNFVIDDGKYFTLSGTTNNSFFASSNRTPNEVKYKCKSKFEPKIMLWIAISSNGVSQPYFHRDKLAENMICGFMTRKYMRTTV